jgi:hypothetical protein
MPHLDYSSFGTTERMAVKYVVAEQEAIHAEISTLREELKHAVEVLRTDATAKVHAYESSRLIRFLKWLRLL